MKRKSPVYESVARRYDEWKAMDTESAARPLTVAPTRPYVPVDRSPEMGRYLFAAVGLGLGALLLLLAVASFWTAAQWDGVARDGASVGYTLVGIFLLIAGFGGIFATWNHNFRVLTDPDVHHH